MSYIIENLEPGERILCQARVHALAYIYPLLLLAGLMAFGGLTGLATTELALTDKRVIGKMGSKKSSLPYAAVESVRIKRGLLGLLFDYGDILITDSNGRNIRFRGIREPIDLQMQIEEAIEKTILGHTLSQAATVRF